MARISRLTLKNYKSFHLQDDFELNNLNILIGRNGTGKSNLISFFRLLCSAANGRLADTIRKAGGLKEIRWRGASAKDPIEWELAFEGLRQIEHPVIYYNSSLALRGNTFGVRSEEISRDPYPGHSTRYRFLGAFDGYPRFLTARQTNDNEAEDLESTDDFPGYSDQELFITQLRDPVRYPLLDEIRYLLSDWTIFRGFGENALNNIYDSQSLDVVSPLRLDAEGRNLVSVLYAIFNDPRYGGTQDRLNEVLSEAFPEFKRLAFPLTARGMAELQWSDRDGWQFSASQMSDGMLRFLGLATLLLLPEPPPLIAIDEPEIGLHPELIPLLAGLMKAASKRTQIIVTTHSPQLLNADEIEPDDVVVVERLDRQTSLQRLDSERLRLWLERYTLGSLWMMGKLERQ